MVKFKTGDVVKLSDYQLMTVRNYVGNGNVICNWFSDDRINESDFHEDLLSFISRDDSAVKEISVGQKVQLKSLGNEMLVIVIESNRILCEWNNPDENKKERKEFFKAQLSIVKYYPIADYVETWYI